MRENNHSVEQVEDVMAYFDGELSPDRAQVVAAHLQGCEDCRHLTDDLRSVSAEMNAWQFEAPDLPMSSELTAALQQQGADASPQPWWSRWLMRPKAPRVGLTLAFGSAVTVVAVIFAVLWTPRSDKGTALQRGPASTTVRVDSSSEDSSVTMYEGIRRPVKPEEAAAPPRSGDRDRLPAPTESVSVTRNVGMAFMRPSSADQVEAAVPHVPMIVRTAELTVIVSDFDSARAALEDILKRHQGYVGEMSTSDLGLGERDLNARLHIPASQLDAALAEFKKLGRAEHESQHGDDVTAQSVDLEARLTNARKIEQRLTELLRTRTGKLDEVVEVEEKISEKREDIERMEAERKSLLTSVQFAALNIRLKQERKAQLQVSPPSLGTRFHNAAVDGYTMLTDGIVGFLEILLSIGPSVLLWGAALFFPLRWAWRRRKRSSAPKEA